MSVNGKDFSGFDGCDTDEKLKLLYRLLVHVETEIDKLRKDFADAIIEADDDAHS